MKYLLAAAFILLACNPLRADELLKNGDFSDGTTLWHGNGKPAGADSSTDLLTNNGATPGGMVVDLRPATWAYVSQKMHSTKVIKTLIPEALKVTIDYQLSPDFSLSTRPEDYQGDDPNVGLGPTLDFDGAKITGRPGQILAFIDVEPTNRTAQFGNTVLVYSDRVIMGSFTPAAGGAKTYSATLTMTPAQESTFCIAFPPGHGSITITKISLSQ